MSTTAVQRRGVSKVTSGILLAVLAAFSFALTGFVANHLVDGGEAGVVVGFYEAVFGLALVLAVNARTLRHKPRTTRSSTLWIVLAAMAFAGGFGSFYTALSGLDYSVGAPILGAVPLVSYVVVLFSLTGQDRITLRALAGATLVVAGVGIIGVAN